MFFSSPGAVSGVAAWALGYPADNARVTRKAGVKCREKPFSKFRGLRIGNILRVGVWVGGAVGPFGHGVLFPTLLLSGP